MSISPLSRPITTLDIARTAGVNPSTVSRALRGVAGVSEGKRKHIRAIAEEFGYRPNPFIAAFNAQVRTYRRKPFSATIALLDCWPKQCPFWADFDKNIDYIGGIRTRADKRGYRIKRIRLANLGWSLNALQQMLATRNIYGLLVLPVPEGTDLTGLDFSHFACAAIDPTLTRPPLLQRSSPDYYYNMRLALMTLADRGYKRIGYVSISDDDGYNPVIELMRAAFLAFREQHPHICVDTCRGSSVERHQVLASWLKREQPDAIITNDLQILDDLISVGYRVPTDVAAVLLSRPPKNSNRVAYIDENYHLVSAWAVDMIVDAIHHNEYGLSKTGTSHLIQGMWREGETVRPVETQRCDTNLNIKSARIGD